VYELNESFTLEVVSAQLAASSTPLLTTDNAGTGTIADNDPTPNMRVGIGTPNPQTEGSTAKITFRISLDRQASQDTIVTYSTADGTAVAGSDFTGISGGQVVIPAGTTSQDVSVSLLNDTTHELTEAFSLRIDAARLANGTVLPITVNDGIGTIVDNDAAPAVAVADGTPNPQAEGTDKQIGFKVSLTRAASQDTIITYSTADGTAVAGSDFTGASNATATISAGSTSTTILINVLNDSLVETPEAFSLRIDAAQLANGTALTVTDNLGTGNIADEAPSVVAIRAIGSTVNLGDWLLA
jgi:membrane protease subunit (stomatin/prohibitin family)